MKIKEENYLTKYEKEKLMKLQNECSKNELVDIIMYFKDMLVIERECHAKTSQRLMDIIPIAYRKN